MSSPHRSALLAAQERLAVLERERVVHPCAVCASKKKSTTRSLLGVVGILAAAAVVGLLFLGPWILVMFSFDMGDIGR